MYLIQLQAPNNSIEISDIPIHHFLFQQIWPEKKALKLTRDENLVLNLLKDNSPMGLNELKAQTGLSNKKWDKAIKGLTKNKLARVEKTEKGLLVSLV